MTRQRLAMKGVPPRAFNALIPWRDDSGHFGWPLRHRRGDTIGEDYRLSELYRALMWASLAGALVAILMDCCAAATDSR
ncbi:MAG: hypothetical protein CM15mP103_06670 [Gammaproteobacteria bacterium]|nr:MAG: hypothetical protein CM15mP103_06670 [Gammaproteobacteria bacterium]